MRSATTRRCLTCYNATSFNPRTPCGVRPRINRRTSGGHRFQSTHSLRSATFVRCTGKLLQPVSIHALLAECDPILFSVHFVRGCFNPRTPCGVRPGRRPRFRRTPMFQSTHSLRSATTMNTQIKLNAGVSIHALLAECDMTWKGIRLFAKSFNPRTPCGVRPMDTTL